MGEPGNVKMKITRKFSSCPVQSTTQNIKKMQNELDLDENTNQNSQKMRYSQWASPPQRKQKERLPRQKKESQELRSKPHGLKNGASKWDHARRQVKPHPRTSPQKGQVRSLTKYK